MPSIRIMLAHFNTTTMALYLRVANCQSVPFQISTTSRTKRNPNDDEPDPDGMDSLRDPDENVPRASPPFAPVYLMGIRMGHTRCLVLREFSADISRRVSEPERKISWFVRSYRGLAIGRGTGSLQGYGYSPHNAVIAC